MPTKILKDLQLPDFFSFIEHLEILQIYQYDRNNFFALYKILLKPIQNQPLDHLLQTFFHAQSFQILEQKSNEILSIIKQRNTSGFWPTLLSGSWALLPPIVIDKSDILFSILAKEDSALNSIFHQLKAFNSVEILAITQPDDITTNFGHALPHLTTRQRTIMTYATRHGYFEIPKKITTKEIANNFKITPSAVINHIQKAEKSLMRFYFG